MCSAQCMSVVDFDSVIITNVSTLQAIRFKFSLPPTGNLTGTMIVATGSNLSREDTSERLRQYLLTKSESSLQENSQNPSSVTSVCGHNQEYNRPNATSFAGKVNSPKRQMQQLERQTVVCTDDVIAEQRRLKATDSAVCGNPPEPHVTLSVKVAEGGVLSIAEHDRQNRPQCGRMTESYVAEPLKRSHRLDERAGVGHVTRTSARSRSAKIPRKIPGSEPGCPRGYRTVHFTLCVANLMKVSDHVDGTSQVELRPLRLGPDPRLPPLYGCIDGKGELQLSMGGYNQNALGRMASLVAAMGLEEKPGDPAEPTAKRVVLNGKTWPTFPVSVTILDNERHPQNQIHHRIQLTATVAPSAPSSILSYGMSTVHPHTVPNYSSPPVEALPLCQNPVIRPVTSSVGVLVSGRETKPPYLGIGSTARYRCMPLKDKTAVLMADNENNSASSSTGNGTQDENLAGTPKLQRTSHYGSTDSICSIDTTSGRLYIADHTNTPPPMSPPVTTQRTTVPGEVSQPESSAFQIDCAHNGSKESSEREVRVPSPQRCVSSPKQELLEDSAFLNTAPVDADDESQEVDDPGTREGAHTASQDSVLDAQAEGVANFLSYLQEMNKLMESVLDKGQVETPTVEETNK
ncbi:uncharacterized protein LOC119736465 [Patiria miniata]|uniref:Uncharacterized protein n=1 Tax=Patiria miniata TaxID=46514 RepID=A0A914AQS7_PATMI|nr:uncharacterized protein LOC119736465 [Patiria miniata]